jgi:asparagine synthase (glutamine-hydrolysing)
MSGLLGDFLVLIGPQHLAAGMADMTDAALWPPLAQDAPVREAAPAANVRVWLRGATRVLGDGAAGGLGLALEPHHGGARSAAADPRDAVVAAWACERRFAHETLHGRYCYVLWEDGGRHVVACTDTMRTCPVFHARVGDGLLLASDLRLLLRSGLVAPRVSPQAVYQFLNFSYVPAPLTAIEGVGKLPAGSCLDWSESGLRVQPYWDLTYPEDAAAPEAQRAQTLRQTIVDTVRDYRCADARGWGTFLSGGTDSSSISGILARAHDAPVHSFSIGFLEDGYDELPYSRIASTHFGLQPHESRVGEDDAVAALARLVAAYDEPFGNASAIPSLHCTDLAARSGVSLLVAGDGGDEIFGGNERYRKDQIFGRFHRAPAPLRALARGIAHLLGGFESRLGNRVRNFVHRASLPNPDRFYSDDAFASKHFDALLGPALRGAVQRDDALDVQRRIYAQAQAGAELHRLMYLDMKMTIADNDLVKVTRAAKVSGVEVAFPYLDRRLVDFTGHLPASDKVRRLNKRHLFKLAMDDILPEAIRRKKKQGFGLPVSVWLRRGGAYADLVTDLVLSDRAAARGYVDPEFVRQLIDRHRRGLWDHAADIHMLAMLELWHREYIDPLVDHAGAVPTRADAAAVAA